MPITVLDFITNQFKKAGVEPTAEMKETLKNPELTNVVLPDLLVKDVNDKLMTIDVAKQSPVLKQHFRFETLNPVDTEIHDKYLSEYEIPDDIANAIRSEKNTYQKIPLLIQAIKQLQEKKATTQVGDKKALIEQIDKLNGDLVSARATAKAEKDNLIAENKNKELNWNVKGSLASYNYIKEYGDRADAVELANVKLQRQLQADNAKIVLTADGQIKIVQASDESLDFTRDNQKVNYKDYIDKLVSENKMIQVTDTLKQNQQIIQPTVTTNGQNKEFIPPRAMADIDTDLANALKAQN